MRYECAPNAESDLALRLLRPSVKSSRAINHAALAKVGIDHSARGFLSILVDVDEVKSLVRGQEHGGLSLRDVQRRMQWSTKVLSALIEQGLLPSTVALNPVNRCPQRIVTSADLEAFDRTFVSITTLSKELRSQNRKLKALLTAAGIDPDPAFEHVPATFYRRAEIQESAFAAYSCGT